MERSVWTDAKVFYEENLAGAEKLLTELRRGQDDEDLARKYEQTIEIFTSILKLVDDRIANNRVGNG